MFSMFLKDASPIPTTFATFNKGDLKHELYSISERTSERLIISRKRTRFLLEFVCSTVFLIAWLACLTQTSSLDDNLVAKFIETTRSPFNWIFLLAAVGIAYKALISVFQLITGDKIVIDKHEKTISKNNKLTIAFHDLDYLQIRKYTDSDGDVDYRLSLVKVNGEKVFVDRTSDKNGIIEFAEEIGDFINKEIKFK
jgi:hypothetical protein